MPRSPFQRRLLSIGARLLLAGASVGLLLSFFEAGLRLAGYRPIYEVYSKPSLLWQRDALLGWAHEPGASGMFVGPAPFPIEFETPIRINSLGLRGPEVEPLSEDGYRVMLLGDSVVAAFEVAYEETFAAIVEERLNRRLDFPVQVLNAGVRGYGTDQSLLYYRERGRALEPDLVLLTHARNDPENNVTLHRMRRRYGKPAFALDAGGSLSLVGHPIPEYPICSARALDESYVPRRVDTRLSRGMCRLEMALLDRSSLFTFFSQRVRRSPGIMRLLHDLGSPRREAALPGLRAAGFAPMDIGAGALVPEEEVKPPLGHDYALTMALLIELAREVRADGAAFVLHISSEQLVRLDAAALAANQVEVLIPKAVEGYENPALYHFENDGHFTPAGHRRVSLPIAKRIEARAREARAEESARKLATAVE